LSKQPASSERPASSLRLLNAVCEDAARLLSDREERPLTFIEKVGLNIHLAICRGCRRYRRSLAILRQILKRAGLRDPAADDVKLPDDARQRISNHLTQRDSNP
jgi:hypothetical protein